MKISLDKAIRLLESVPLEDVSNEANFLAPLHTTGRTASVLCEDVNYGKRLVAGELGTENVWWELEMQEGKVKVTGTVQDSNRPIRGSH